MRPAISTVLRDTGTWVGGWVLIFKQAGIVFAPPTQVNETLIWVAAVLIGVPGAAQVWAGRSGQTGGTGASSTSPALPDSPSSSAGAPSPVGEP
jgi:hypothetical protein